MNVLLSNERTNPCAEQPVKASVASILYFFQVTPTYELPKCEVSRVCDDGGEVSCSSNVGDCDRVDGGVGCEGHTYDC